MNEKHEQLLIRGVICFDTIKQIYRKLVKKQCLICNFERVVSMKQFLKKIIVVLVLSMMFTSVVSSTVTVSAKTINYRKRTKKAKKNLCKKVRKMLKADFYKPSCKVRKSRREGKFLFCSLMCSIGGGACDFLVRVDLDTGLATILYDSEGIFIYDDEDWDDDADGYVGEYSFWIRVK